MANDEWRTPEWVWKPYGPFDLDAAATAENSLAPKYISKEEDALGVDWREFAPVGSKIWCNPPYSPAAGPLMKWCEAFMYWQANGFRVTALLPADTSTKWFHLLWGEHRDVDPWENMCRITFLEHRVRHIDPNTGKLGGSPKFGSLIVEFIP